MTGSHGSRVPYVFDTDTWQVHRHASLDTFVHADAIDDGYHVIIEGPSDLPIVILNEDRGYDTTVVFFSGAKPLERDLPFFTGEPLSRSRPVNRLFISDPSLAQSPEANLGWYVGNPHQALQPILQRIIARVYESHASARHLVFFGGSAGAFSSLYFARLFPGAWAFIWNPQTDIARYRDFQVERWTRYVFGRPWAVGDPLPTPEGYVTSLLEPYGAPSDNTVVILQNEDDAFHIEGHLLPWLGAVHPSIDVRVYIARWGEGHAFPEKTILSDSFDAVIRRDREWLDAVGFVDGRTLRTREDIASAADHVAALAAE